MAQMAVRAAIPSPRWGSVAAFPPATGVAVDVVSIRVFVAASDAALPPPARHGPTRAASVWMVGPDMLVWNLLNLTSAAKP
jgi:hypothetical protein